jgi:hypothetical protein
MLPEVTSVGDEAKGLTETIIAAMFHHEKLALLEF